MESSTFAETSSGQKTNPLNTKIYNPPPLTIICMVVLRRDAKMMLFDTESISFYVNTTDTPESYSEARKRFQATLLDFYSSLVPSHLMLEMLTLTQCIYCHIYSTFPFKVALPSCEGASHGQIAFTCNTCAFNLANEYKVRTSKKIDATVRTKKRRIDYNLTHHP